MKTLIKVCFTALAILLAATPLLACGAPEAPAPSPPPAPSPAPPTGNRPPVITSITPEATKVTHGATSQITCSANDPDDDTLSYTWSATGGTISAVKQICTWTAPNFDGEFVISVTVEDGKGGTTAKSCTLTVQANQRPVISSITAEPAKLQREETSIVTCLASDPDGDKLTYAWSASGGIISGTGNMVTWKAPSVAGEFVISVSANDGKGGTTESSCRIVVAIPEVTVILTPLTGESGSVYYDGGIITPFRIGDNAANVGVRPYFSFDITGLAGAEIKQAKLTFTIKEVVNNPWFVPPFLYVDSVDYGARALQAADFHLMIVNEIERFDSEPPREVDVHLRLNQALKYLKPRLQVRLRLATDHNFNSLEDYIEFNKVELTVTYVK